MNDANESRSSRTCELEWNGYGNGRERGMRYERSFFSFLEMEMERELELELEVRCLLWYDIRTRM